MDEGRTSKVSGTRNEYRIVKQENYMLHDGIHEGIISETDWELAHQKREKTGVKYEKTHSLDHEAYLIWNIEMSVMWKRYVWEREPKEKERRNLI